MSGWHCRRSSMSNNIDRARTRNFFKLTNIRWQSKQYSACFCGIFRVEEYVDLIWEFNKTITLN